MTWYIIAGLVLAAAAAAAAWYHWGRHKMPPPKCPGPPLNRRPCWCSIRGKETPKELGINRSSQRSRTFHLHGGDRPLEVQVGVETSDGRPWLVADQNQFWLPVGGSMPVEIKLASLDASLADLDVKELTATLRCITPDNRTANPEIKFRLNLEWWREAQIKEEPFQVSGIDPAHPEKVAHPLSGQIQLNVTNPHPFAIRLEKIGVRGMELRKNIGPNVPQKIDPIDIDSQQTVSLPLLLTGSSSNWVKVIPAHLRAKVSYQGSWGVPRERRFTLFPEFPRDFKPREEHRILGSIVPTINNQERRELLLPLPSPEQGYRVKYENITLYYHIGGSPSQYSYSFPKLEEAGTGVKLTDSLRVASDARGIKLTSSEPRNPEEWPIGVGIQLVLTNKVSGFSCTSFHMFSYSQP